MKYTIYIYVCKMKNIKIFRPETMIVILLFTIDSITKAMFIQSQGNYITTVFNTVGARWIPFPMRLLIWISVIAIIFCFIAYARKIIPFRTFVLLLSWWLWNLFDRVVFWWVRDWVNIQIIPVFNLADVFITLWVCVFIYHELYIKKWNH